MYALQQIESHDIYQMNDRNAADSRQGLYFNQGNSIMAAEEQADRPDMRGKGLYESEAEYVSRKLPEYKPDKAVNEKGFSKQ